MIYILLLAITLVGCNDKSKSNYPTPAPKQSEQTDMMYSGQHKGCVAYYDELFCPKKYTDGTLNAGEVIFVVDENGSMVILREDTNSTKYSKMVGDK